VLGRRVLTGRDAPVSGRSRMLVRVS